MRLLLFILLFAVAASASAAENVATSFITGAGVDWAQLEKAARGQTVWFHAWGGSSETNAWLQREAAVLQKKYGITLKQVKVADISRTVARLLAEKGAGVTEGSADLLWLNGKNFRTLKQAGLLFGPFTELLPNWTLVNRELPVDEDFTTPVAGMEAPWGVGQLVFLYDAERLPDPPATFAEMLEYAKAHPGRLSYPRPPDFHGSSFLKAALLELCAGRADFNQPVNPETFQQVTAPLWAWLDAFHPLAWQQGRQFPAGSAETMQLLDDGQLDLAIAFNPQAAQAAQARGALAPSVKAYALRQGALSNLHFLAIPKTARNKAAALVVINEFLSPEAQRSKAQVAQWGDPSVLQPEALSGDDAGEGAASGFSLFPVVREPHPSWQKALEKEWEKRYGE